MSGNLDRMFTSEEVAAALKQMSPFKSPRPNGFGTGFYQDHWEIMGNEVSQAVLDFLKNGHMPRDLNHTHIAMIPKLLHTMQSRQKGREGSMAIKLEMSNAYDRVKWDYLEAMLIKLGFGQNWTRLVMECVRSVTYSVLTNGVPGETISPLRGLRQGDPLSSYLFLICAEGLSSLLQKAESSGAIKG
ncbi:hypothetical protein F2P56_011179 [Juglans regia]|uniref:Uncharacterized protein LOC108983973 n=2 Tax=Juglans regia TaxID=51240 RepID=A0A2I4DVZ6_JUGRE|nr:uncharacterized protein LOC108983973 [Juglans regia]KAF5470682.1 hypothetical protein F2P56_011179 [Juglans regia]